MATAPTKARTQGRAQSPGPLIAAGSPVTSPDKITNAQYVWRHMAEAQAAEQTPARRGLIFCICRMLAKVLGLAGFVLLFGLEWSEHCQHRSVDAFMNEMTGPVNMYRTCYWIENEQGEQELQCNEQEAPDLDGRTFTAAPSALCPGTRFDSLGATSESLYRYNPDDFNINGTHTFELLELKIGYPLHIRIRAKWVGLLAMMLCALVLLPCGSGVLAVLLLNVCTVASVMHSGVGDANKRMRSIAAFIASTLVLIFLARVCKITASEDGGCPDDAIVKKRL